MVYRRRNAQGKERPNWFFRFKLNGISYRVNTKQNNKDVAEKRETLYKARLLKGEAGIPDWRGIPTLEQFEPKFVEYVEAEKGKSTAKNTKIKMATLLAFKPLANARLDRIGHRTDLNCKTLIEKFIEHRLEEGVTPATVNRGLAALRRCLRLAAEKGFISAAPPIKLLPGERSREFVLSRDKEPEYLAACPPILRDIATVLLDTGLRVGEVRNLEWRDVHLQPVGRAKFGYLRVREGKTKNAARTVSLTQRVVDVLKEQLKTVTDQLVFSDGNGKPYKDTHLSHLQAKVRDGLEWPKDFCLHSLRHTFLTRLGEAGVDAFTIKRIAGHSSITVSQRYIHPSDEAMERAFEKLAGCTPRAPESVTQIARAS